MEQTIPSLYDDKLVLLSGSLVERYNQALDSLGIERTSLTSFYIDAFGWSPQIAEEKENKLYLSHGNNLPYGIIITPEQSSCTTLNAHHTFDTLILQNVFSKYEERIKQMTLWTAVVITTSSDQQYIDNPYDYLKIKDITITCDVPYFVKKAKKEQDVLVQSFCEGDNALDETLHEKLLQSAKQYGDLRDKEFGFDPITCSVGKVIYTEAYGGIYCIHENNRNIIVFETKAAYKKWHEDVEFGITVYHIDDEDLSADLKSINMLRISVYEEPLQFLSNVRFASTIAKSVPEGMSIQDILKNPALKQKYYEMHKDKLELCVLYRKLHDSFRKLTPDALKLMLQNSGELVEYLYVPHESLQAHEQSTMWQLLTDRKWDNIAMLYKHNRDYLEQLYKKWPKAMQEWVAYKVKK